MNHMNEALIRIRHEAQERTGELDLRGLDLKGLPKDLWGLTHLRKLYIGRDEGGRGSAEIGVYANRFMNLDNLQVLVFTGTDIENLQFIRSLKSLEMIDCTASKVIDLSPLTDLPHLRVFLCRHTSVNSLSPLAGLSELQELDCSHTQVSDLSPLAGSSRLRLLNCSCTPVSDLSPLGNLSELEKIECFQTPISDLSPLRNLSKLKHLSCADTKIEDLSALKSLWRLTHLSCSKTRVSNLGPLAKIAGLQHLYISSTFVVDLKPLQNIMSIMRINISHTDIKDISPLRKMKKLKHINCSFTKIKDISALINLRNIVHIDVSSCRLQGIPNKIISSPSLRKLYMAQTFLPGWPSAGVLSKDYGDNCLPRVRAHLKDMKNGAQIDQRLKLLILGNGRVGKTQIANWLCDDGYQLDRNSASTHGIQVKTAKIGTAPTLTLSIWDFGGQDVYHNTHALFLSSPALLLLVWAKYMEARGGQEDAALWSRDHPLPYWLALVRHQAHRFSPILLVQSKCAQTVDRAMPFPVEYAMLSDLPYHPPPLLHLSVGAGKGRAHLCEELEIAAEWLRNPARMGAPEVGTVRLEVRNALEARRAEGERLISMTEFRGLCASLGGVSAPEHLLVWLDAEGAVFHRPGLFEDRVVLDPSWALDAIYAIFDRESGLVKQIKEQEGRFRADLLARTVWQNFEEGERRLFLSMMVSCGICFLWRERQEGEGGVFREYVAPDLLPEPAAVVGEVPVIWSPSAPVREAEFTYPMLHGGLIRTILSLIGKDAGPRALYWRGGVCGYETRLRSRFLIEQDMTGEWEGRVRLRTQDGDAEGLLARLVGIVEKAQAMVGLRGDRPELVREVVVAEELPEVPLRTGTDPVPVRQWYVSYAWDDGTDAGRARVRVVDDLCAEAGKRGIRILRDRDVLHYGDSIEAFMGRLIASERVFVVLSKGYLQSPNCMHELHSIWRHSGGDAAFSQRVRMWATDDANIWKPTDWMFWARHWHAQYQELEAALRPAPDDPVSLLDEGLIRRLKRVDRFRADVSTILQSLSDRKQPREWGDFLEHGFGSWE